MRPELVFELIVALDSVRRCGRWERWGRGDGVGPVSSRTSCSQWRLHRVAGVSAQGHLCTVALARPGGSVLVSLRDYLDG